MKRTEGVRLVKWYKAGIQSQQLGFHSCLNKTIKNYQKPPSVPLITASRKAYLNNVLINTYYEHVVLKNLALKY